MLRHHTLRVDEPLHVEHLGRAQDQLVARQPMRRHPIVSTHWRCACQATR